MFADMFKYSAVICLTFSSMVQNLALPQATIIEKMREELRNCSFPPAEVLNDRQGGIFSLCAVTKPALVGDKPSADDLNFAFGKYLCMELFDLSLQLCSRNISKVKLPSSTELSQYILAQNVSLFCDNLQFFGSRAKSNSLWTGIAIETLKNRTLCESHCIKQNYLNPVCGAISLASKLILGSQKQAVGTSDSQDEVQTTRATETNPLKTEPASQPITKEEVTTKVTNGSKTEIKAQPGVASEISRPSTIEETFKKEEEVNPVGAAVVKHTSSVNQTQHVSVTSTVSSVTAEAANVNVEKDDEHDDDHIHPSRMEVGDTPGIEDNRMPADDELGNLVSKEMGQDTFPDEAANELPIETRDFQDTFVDAQDSHFFAYFLTMVVICIVGYLLFHNKQKIIALALEGRRMQGSRRRPNTSSYKKLDSNLEEAVTSTCSSSSVTHVIF